MVETGRLPRVCYTMTGYHYNVVAGSVTFSTTVVSWRWRDVSGDNVSMRLHSAASHRQPVPCLLPALPLPRLCHPPPACPTPPPATPALPPPTTAAGITHYCSSPSLLCGAAPHIRRNVRNTTACLNANTACGCSCLVTAVDGRARLSPLLPTYYRSRRTYNAARATSSSS